MVQVLCSPWADLDDVPDAVREALDDTTLETWLAAASHILWALSGRRWLGGGCEADVVLRAAPPAPGEATYPYDRSWGRCGCWSGGWGADGWPLWLGRPRSGHAAPYSVRLPHPNVTAVTGVTVGGAPFAAWRLDGGWLARTDGRGWGVCGDAATEVAYTYGLAPPEGGRELAAWLGAELAKAAVGGDCRLPTRVQSVTRQGVTIARDDLAMLDKGRTGIYQVDLWLRAVNPHGRSEEALVWSPDLPSALRR